MRLREHDPFAAGLRNGEGAGADELVRVGHARTIGHHRVVPQQSFLHRADYPPKDRAVANDMFSGANTLARRTSDNAESHTVLCGGPGVNLEGRQRVRPLLHA